MCILAIAEGESAPAELELPSQHHGLNSLREFCVDQSCTVRHGSASITRDAR